MTTKLTDEIADQAAEDWLLGVQRKLFQWSSKNPDSRYRELWNWVTDPRNLRCAWRQVAANRGARTAGIDGNTVRRIQVAIGRDDFLETLREDLRAGRYQPSPCRRKWIPKPGKPGQFRPLGIPTVRDRIEIPKHRQADLRYRVKLETRRGSTHRSLTEQLLQINPILRGWGHYYRFCTGASAVFNSLDFYVGNRLWLWLMAKHKGLGRIRSKMQSRPSFARPTRRVWREGNTEQFLLKTLPVLRFQRGWMRKPPFSSVPAEQLSESR